MTTRFGAGTSVSPAGAFAPDAPGCAAQAAAAHTPASNVTMTNLIVRPRNTRPPRARELFPQFPQRLVDLLQIANLRIVVRPQPLDPLAPEVRMRFLDTRQ